ITEQTIAGALGTGTHAQGTGEGLIADTVLSIDYLDATGQLRRIERGGEAFGAFQLHLGSLGLITELTLAVTPNRDYVAHKYTTSGTDLRENFQTWNDRSDHVKAWWFTEEDRVHVWEVSPADATTVLDPTATTHDDLNPVLQATQQRMGAELNSDDRSIAPQRTVGRFYDYSDTSGDLVEIFRNGIPAPQINMEVGVPLDRFGAAADDLRQLLATSRYRLHYPVILRPTGPTEAWLAAAYARPTCWFGFVVYQRADGSVGEGSVELLREIQEVLAAHAGLPHWGKYFDPRYFDFTSIPRWGDFQSVRHRLDPRGRFLHPQLAALMG
ncbi:MAG: D-arabinono-1,4-lactone oxidase, partial [Propionibacteriaceae bacterium]|nr:D-arabinono-1,4-lactone oxidase [Propionibacteriaceae bacterium]